MAAAKHVEGAIEIDIDHGAKGVGRHAEHRREEIARGARYDDVYRAELVRYRLHHPANRAIIAHIARQPDRVMADFVSGAARLVGIAPRDGNARAEFGKTLGNAKVDAARAARNESGLAGEQIVAKTGHGLTLPFAVSAPSPRAAHPCGVDGSDSVAF